MSKLNLLVFLNSYSDSQSSNIPSMNNFRWTRDVSGLSAANPISISAQLAASEARTIFTGSAIKKLIYVEADQNCTLLINGTDSAAIKPLVLGTFADGSPNNTPGMFIRTDNITSLAITNGSSTTLCNIFVAAIE